LLGELLYQCLKPFLWVYDWLLWWWYRSRDQREFLVLGHCVTVLPKDKGISRELAVHRVHEPLATHLLSQVLEPGMNVVDVGSNIGYYVLVEARLIGPRGTVIAIEPVKENVRQLLLNIQANRYSNVLIHELAISNRSGTAEIHVSQKSNWHSLGPVPWPTTKRRVPVSTLDDVLARYSLRCVDLVRMDLEGHEVTVMQGMHWTLSRYSPRLLVELHPHVIGAQPITEYLHTLQSLGYEVEWLFEQERDVPMRWRFVKVEKPAINELVNDPRICENPRALTVLFSKSTSERSPVKRANTGRRRQGMRPGAVDKTRVTL